MDVKIWEFEFKGHDTPELILDYYCDPGIDFYPAARAIEQVVGVEWVEVYPGENKMRVILRKSPTVYDKLGPIFKKLYGIPSVHAWKHPDEQY